MSTRGWERTDSPGHPPGTPRPPDPERPAPPAQQEDRHHPRSRRRRRPPMRERWACASGARGAGDPDARGKGIPVTF